MVSRGRRTLFEQAPRVGGHDAAGWVPYRIAEAYQHRPIGRRVMDGLGVFIAFLRQANGRGFCDGCLALEFHVEQFNVRDALDGNAASIDRGHGRCSVCGQTLTVTRVGTD
jgi:hypothetical protein